MAASLSSDNATATAVFIDTNLDTHLAIDVFDHDTASDLKKKIESEHPSIYPKFGHIHVHGIKVKRKGYFYQLTDSMRVRNAFNGFNKSWFVSVEISALGEGAQSDAHGSPNQVVCHGVVENALVCHGDNSASKRVSSLDNLQLLQSENKLDEGEGIHNVSPCVSERTDRGAVKNLEKSAGKNEDGIPVHGSIPEAEERGFVNHEVLPSSSGTGIKDVCDVREDDLPISVPSSKTKQKRKRKREDAAPGYSSKDNIASVDNPLRRPSKRTSSMNNSQVPLLEKKQDENEEVPVVVEVVKNLEIDVNSSGNNDPGISLTSSLPHTQDNCCVNHELPNSHIECAVDGSNTSIKEDSIELDEGMCKTAPATKKRKKSKRKKEVTVQYENEDNIASVDNLPSRSSKRTSSMNNSQVPLLEKKQDENEEVPVVGKVVKNLEIDVKSSGNNDPGISLTSSLPETRDSCCVNHELPNSHIECPVDGSHKGIKEGSVLPDEGMCKTTPATKKRHKSKRKKEDTVQGDNTKDNITSIDNPPRSPSKRASSMDNSQVPLLEKKQDENEEVPVVGKVVKNLEIDVKSSGNNDPGISLTSSLPETRDNSCVNHELPDSHIECPVHGSNKGIKEGSVVPDEGMCKTTPATKKRQKSKRKKEDTVQGDNTKDNITSVDNPPRSPSKRASSMNNSQVPLLEKKQDENEEVPVVGKDVKNLEIDVKSSGNNDPGISLTSSLPETRDNSCVNHELPDSHIECPVHGSNKGIKEGSVVPDEGMCKTTPATKKRQKSKRKKEDTVQGDNTKDNITSVDNPPRSPSKRASSMNNSPVPLLEKKQDENEEVPVVGKVVKNLEIDVKSSGNNDPGISLTSSLPETRDNSCVNHELPDSHIECPVHGSNKGIKEGSVVPDEGMCKTAPATKKRQKSKRKKEDTVQGDNTKDNITSVDNPPRSPSKRASSMNNSQVPLLEKKQDENEEVPVVGEVVKNLEIDVKSSGNNDPGISLTSSLPETRDNCSGNHELPISHIECAVDGSNEGTKEGSVVSDEGMCKTAPATKKRQKSKRKKEDTVQGDNTKDNITSVDNPLSSPSQRASSLKNFHMPQLENKQTVGAEEECDVPKIHPDKKVQKVHKTRQDAKMSSPSDSAMSSVKVNSKPRKSASGESMDLEKRREHLLISNSKLESSNKMVKNKAGKASGNNVWGVVSNIQQRKSLLAGGIFKDDSSWTSQDEDDNSDVSTRTRSDNSLMSDFSDGDSSSDLDSQQHGAYGGDRMENGGRSSLKANLSSTKGMSIELLLKSSSMYKKAKIRTSQLDATESQPEFVPDSLADEE